MMGAEENAAERDEPPLLIPHVAESAATPGGRPARRLQAKASIGGVEGLRKVQRGADEKSSGLDAKRDQEGLGIERASGAADVQGMHQVAPGRAHLPKAGFAPSTEQRDMPEQERERPTALLLADREELGESVPGGGSTPIVRRREEVSPMQTARRPRLVAAAPPACLERRRGARASFRDGQRWRGTEPGYLCGA